MKKSKPFYNTIYAWRDGNIYYAYALAKLKDGKEQGFGKGWKIEAPGYGLKDNPIMNKKRARRYAMTDVNNVLNSIRLYGNKILDANGNVSWEKLERTERLYAEKVVDFADKFEILKFPNRDIKLKEAVNLGIA